MNLHITNVFPPYDNYIINMILPITFKNLLSSINIYIYVLKFYNIKYTF